MNQGIFDGLNHGATPFIPSQFYTGYWGDLRPILGAEEFGATAFNPNTNLTLGVPYINPLLTPQETGWMTACLETPFDAEAFELQCLGAFSQSGTNAHFTVTIGLATVSKVQILMDRFVIANRYTAINSAGNGELNIGPFPIFIPAGSKIVYKLNLEAASANAIMTGGEAILVHLHKRYPRPGNSASLVGGYPSSNGVATAAGADVDSAWGTIGFLPFDTTWVVACPAIGGDSSSYSATGGWAVDYAYVDKDGTVVEFLSNITGAALASESQWSLNRSYPVNLSNGTEIQARARFGDTTNNVGFFANLMAIGVDHVDSGRRPIGPTSLAIS